MPIRHGVAVAMLLLAAGARAAEESTAQIDTRPLNLRVDDAFADVTWEDWESAEETGRIDPLRPMLVTHAHDGSGRVFIPTEQGVIYVLPDRRDAQAATKFLDLRDRVSYEERSFEEGFLGLAFHPRYRQNGELFVFYTNLHEPHQNVLARYRVSRDDPNRADPASEQILLVIDKPFWNHDGGTIVFRSRRILVRRGRRRRLARRSGAGRPTAQHAVGKNPADRRRSCRRQNGLRDSGRQSFCGQDRPVGGADGRGVPRGEIWAYGLRNVWRMAFDRQTGQLWAADVGQDLWEEIDLIDRGGNYGWNLREARHPFGPQESGHCRI